MIRMSIPPVFLLWICVLVFPFTAGLQASDLPTPESVLGFPVGEDNRLADWDMMLDYFHKLDQASDCVAVQSIGKSTHGRDMIVAVISSKENIQSMDSIRAGLKGLADPRSLSQEEAEALTRNTPIPIFVSCAQHSTEIGSTQASMELAYLVAGEDSSTMEQIRNEVVFVLVPCSNPDGHQMVCDWYNAQLGTPYEGSRMPWIYHEYVGHDINRDWAMLTQVECRNVSRVLYEDWFPPVMIDIHQMGNRGARMFIPPYYDPVNPNLDPMLQHELALIGAQMRVDMSAAGHRGIISSAMFDEWLLGYMTSVPTRHNMVAQLIEMASVNVASPMFQRQSDLRGTKGMEYGRRANFPEPWEGGWWRLRHIVDYEITAIRSVLGLASRNRESFLSNFYALGCKQIELGRTEPPYAFLVPPGQADPATAWKMLDVLQAGGVEVHASTAPFDADGVTYPEGTRVVLMAQPFRAHAKDMLEKQVYPNLRAYPGGPPERPYDMAGWTLPFMMGVKTVEVVNSFEADLEKLTKREQPPEGVIENPQGGTYLLLPRRQNQSYRLVNRLLAAGAKVHSLSQDTTLDGVLHPAGTFVVQRGEETMRQVKALGLHAAAATVQGDVPGTALKPIRFGLYKPWTASMDEGWTRWMLEQFEFPVRSIHDAEIRAGNLIQRYDAIVLPDLRTSSITEGNREGSVPEKYTGGIGEEGIFALRDFVREGGTLIALDSSCDFVIDNLELPIKNVLRQDRSSRRSFYEFDAAPEGKKESKRFFCPGSLLRVSMDVSHPLAYGLDPATAILHMSSPAFEVVTGKDKDKKPGKDKDDEKGPGAVMVGSYPRINPLMSGWLENDDLIRGKGVLARASFGKGQAVLIGFRCQFRAQTHGTFKVLFNALLSAASGDR